MNESMRTYRRLLGYSRPYVWGYVVAIAGMIAAAATEPLFPALMKTILDDGFVRNSTLPIWVVPTAIISIFLVRGAATFFSQYALAWVAQKTLVDLRHSMFTRMLRFPARDFEREASGVLISRVVFEVHSVLDAASGVLTVIVRDTLVVIGLLAWMSWLNWKLTLVALILIPTLALSLSRFSVRMRRLNRQTLENTAELTRVVEEAVHGFKVIKVFGGYGRQTKRFGETIERLRGFSIRMTVATAVTTPITQVLAALAVAAVVTIALVEARSGNATIGDFVSFITAMLMLLAPLKHLADINASVQRGLAAAEKVFEFLDRDVENDAGSVVLDRATGLLHFENVSFRYPEAPRDALSDIELLIRPGEVVALVGPSGGGKSTLMNLVPRFLTPASGRVLLDGVPVSELTLTSLRSQIALVSQEIVLFNDTVRENVAFGVAYPVSDAQIWAALADASLDSVVRAMALGLDTVIGERGSTLSGGQRQRLALARAILRNAPILLLDEATSALDAETERQVQHALERTMHGRTTLVVAHRMSTVERADRIVVIESGRVVEQGSHGALLRLSGVYARLYGAGDSNAQHFHP